MDMPTQAQLDAMRQRGVRPQVVGCCVRDKKILFVYKKKHDLWQLPQGGIDVGETLTDAVYREMEEELGKTFVDGIEGGDIFYAAELQLSKQKRKMMTESGEERRIKGKYYHFVTLYPQQDQIDIAESEFDKAKWYSYDQAMGLMAAIYQEKKQTITKNALKQLRSLDIL